MQKLPYHQFNNFMMDIVPIVRVYVIIARNVSSDFLIP